MKEQRSGSRKRFLIKRRREISQADGEARSRVEVSRRIFTLNDVSLSPDSKPQNSEVEHAKTFASGVAVVESEPSLSGWQQISEAHPNIQYRVITSEEWAAEIEESRAQAKKSLDDYYRGRRELGGKNGLRQFVYQSEIGPDFRSTVGAATIVEADRSGRLVLSGDRLGIFKASSELSGHRMGQFFQGLMDSSIDMARRIHDYLYDRASFAAKVWDDRQGDLTRDEIITLRVLLKETEDKNSPPASQDEIERFLALSRLISELSGILNITPAEKQRLQNTPFKDRNLRQKGYNFSQPATVSFEIDNTRSGNTVGITVVGLTQSFYEGRGMQRFNGVLPEEAKIYMHEDARDGRKAEDIDEIIKAAQETLTKPHVEFSLYSRDRTLVARVHGELVENSAGDDIESELLLKSDDFPNILVPYGLGKRPKNIKGLTEAELKTPLQTVAEDFAKLSII